MPRLSGSFPCTERTDAWQAWARQAGRGGPFNVHLTRPRCRANYYSKLKSPARIPCANACHSASVKVSTGLCAVLESRTKYEPLLLATSTQAPPPQNWLLRQSIGDSIWSTLTTSFSCPTPNCSHYVGAPLPSVGAVIPGATRENCHRPNGHRAAPLPGLRSAAGMPPHRAPRPTAARRCPG